MESPRVRRISGKLALESRDPVAAFARLVTLTREGRYVEAGPVRRRLAELGYEVMVRARPEARR